MEDNHIHREALCESLMESGYECVSAERGEEALANLKSMAIDLILTDHRMSPMTGLDLIRELSKDQVMKGIPVILYTGYPEDEILRLGKQTGACRTLCKPLDYGSLIVAIEDALKRKVAKRSG